jgi:hypothetical protein
MSKIGEGHASAWMRQGLRELRGAFYPESNIATNTEYGIFGTRTPGEIAADRKDDPSPTLEDEGSVLQQKIQASIDKAQGMSRDQERDIVRS